MIVYAPNTDMMRPIESCGYSRDKKLVLGTIFTIRESAGDVSIHLDHRVNERPSMALQLMHMLRSMIAFINHNSPRTLEQVERLVEIYCRNNGSKYNPIYDSAYDIIWKQK